jgi:hypothetical protein
MNQKQVNRSKRSLRRLFASAITHVAQIPETRCIIDDSWEQGILQLQQLPQIQQLHDASVLKDIQDILIEQNENRIAHLNCMKEFLHRPLLFVEQELELFNVKLEKQIQDFDLDCNSTASAENQTENKCDVRALWSQFGAIQKRKQDCKTTVLVLLQWNQIQLGQKKGFLKRLANRVSDETLRTLLQQSQHAADHSLCGCNPSCVFALDSALRLQTLKIACKRGLLKTAQFLLPQCIVDNAQINGSELLVAALHTGQDAVAMHLMRVPELQRTECADLVLEQEQNAEHAHGEVLLSASIHKCSLSTTTALLQSAMLDANWNFVDIFYAAMTDAEFKIRVNAISKRDAETLLNTLLSHTQSPGPVSVLVMIMEQRFCVENMLFSVSLILDDMRVPVSANWIDTINVRILKRIECSKHDWLKTWIPVVLNHRRVLQLPPQEVSDIVMTCLRLVLRELNDIRNNADAKKLTELCFRHPCFDIMQTREKNHCLEMMTRLVCSTEVVTPWSLQMLLQEPSVSFEWIQCVLPDIIRACFQSGGYNVDVQWSFNTRLRMGLMLLSSSQIQIHSMIHDAVSKQELSEFVVRAFRDVSYAEFKALLSSSALVSRIDWMLVAASIEQIPGCGPREKVAVLLDAAFRRQPLGSRCPASLQLFVWFVLYLACFFACWVFIY